MPDVVQFTGCSDYVPLVHSMPTTGPGTGSGLLPQGAAGLGMDDARQHGQDRIREAKVILEAPEKDPLRLELLADKQGPFVRIGADRPG